MMADDKCVEGKHESVVERYYSPKYVLDSGGKKGEDLCILLHSNRICIVTVARSHPLLTDEKQIESINFEVEKGINRLENKVSGKGKRGAQVLNPSSSLCHVTCKDGEKYTIRCGIKGQLVEVNENLVTKPDLITKKPQSDGFIAIVLPKLKEYDQMTKNLITQKDFDTIRRSLTST